MTLHMHNRYRGGLALPVQCLNCASPAGNEGFDPYAQKLRFPCLLHGQKLKKNFFNSCTEKEKESMVLVLFPDFL